MIPKWSTKARAALAYLYRPLQDVDVYVEDLHDTVFYTELMNRIAPSNVRIARVFESGNRGKVVSAALNHNFADRRALFLVDGDFEWVRDEPSPPFVHRLDAYCIENLLLREEAAIQVLRENVVISIDEAKRRLDFPSWSLSILGDLLDLFVALTALNKVNPSEATVGLGIGRILTQSKKGIPPMVDVQKVAKLTRDVKAKTRLCISQVEAVALESAIENRLRSLPNTLDAISGKDFLFPLFELRLKSLTSSTVNRESLRFRLARHCVLGRFEALTEALKSA